MRNSNDHARKLALILRSSKDGGGPQALALTQSRIGQGGQPHPEQQDHRHQPHPAPLDARPHVPQFGGGRLVYIAFAENTGHTRTWVTNMASAMVNLPNDARPSDGSVAED